MDCGGQWIQEANKMASTYASPIFKVIAEPFVVC